MPCYPFVSEQVLLESYIPLTQTRTKLASNSPSASCPLTISMTDLIHKVQVAHRQGHSAYLEALEPLNRMIVTLTFDVFLKMMLLDNFTHADLHPGNLFVSLYERQIPAEGPVAPQGTGESKACDPSSKNPSSQSVTSHWWLVRSSASIFEYFWQQQQHSLLKFILQLFLPLDAINRPHFPPAIKQPVALSTFPEPASLKPDGPLNFSEAEMAFLKACRAGQIEPKLHLLDVGLVTSLYPDKYDNFLALFKEIVLWRNGYQAARLLIERAPGSTYQQAQLVSNNSRQDTSASKHISTADTFHIWRVWMTRLSSFFKDARGLKEGTLPSATDLQCLNPTVRDPEGFARKIQWIIDVFFKGILTDMPSEMDYRVEPGEEANGLKREIKTSTSFPNLTPPSFPLHAYHVTPVLLRVLNLVQEHQVRLDDHYTNLIMSMIFVEGLGRTLCPGIDLFPFLRQAAFHYLLAAKC
jgi:predicted unusual protein kinase regulating ubiquinone biosynthesis (AarF/ABC1/UbiB family)